VAEIRGRGLLQAVELVRERATLAPFPAEDRITATVVGGRTLFVNPDAPVGI